MADKSESVLGIHHITAISSDAQKTYDFYTNTLGLRMVKQTVNFDSPDTYHLYFADSIGNPGTVLTFFPFENAGTGMRGTGQVTSIQFAIPKNSLGFWMHRFVEKKIKHKSIIKKFGHSTITFYDFDGLQLELVATDDKYENEIWGENGVDKSNAIKGFYGAELSVQSKKQTEEIITNILGYELVETQDLVTRYKVKSGIAKYLDIFEMKGWPAGIQSAATVHHIAFGVSDDEHQFTIAEKVKQKGIQITEQIDRNYFKSMYFREPGNILFELATVKPGFLIDESKAELGNKLQIPKQYEHLRKSIETNLKPLVLSSSEQNDYVHKFIEGNNDKTLILFHGTGGNENSLVEVAQELDPNANILSIRGDVNENGMLRFFKRFADGTFDEEDMNFRLNNIVKFIANASQKYNFSLDKAIYTGYSNGANTIGGMLFLNKLPINYAALLRPTLPFQKIKPKTLKGNIFIAHSTNDGYVDELSFGKFIKILKDNDVEINLHTTNIGHQLDENDFRALKLWYKNSTK